MWDRAEQRESIANPGRIVNELLCSWLDAQSWRELTHTRIDNPYYAAAAFLAVLTYPDNTHKRDRLIAAMCDYCRFTWGMPQSMRKRDVERALKRCSKLVNRRFRAAGMAAKVMLEKASSTGMTFETARSIREAISREGESMTLHLPTAVLPGGIVSQPERRNSQPRGPRPGADFDTNVIRDVWSPVRLQTNGTDVAIF